MNRKHIQIIILAIFLLFLFLFVTQAHPGRTDANGGHWNHSTGEYHFHTGEYAGRPQSGSESKSTPSDFEPPYTPPPRPTPQPTPYFKDASDAKGWIPLIITLTLLFGPAILEAVYAIGSWIYDDYIKNLIPSYKLNQYQTELQSYIILQKKLANARIPLHSVVPEAYEIGADKLPKEKHSADWGYTFTLYTSKSGNKIHKKYKCSGATVKRHICECSSWINDQSSLCQRCCKDFAPPSLYWYAQYNQLVKDKTNYQSNLQSAKEKELILNAHYVQCNKSITKWLIRISKKRRKQFDELNAQYETICKPERKVR